MKCPAARPLIFIADLRSTFQERESCEAFALLRTQDVHVGSAAGGEGRGEEERLSLGTKSRYRTNQRTLSPSPSPAPASQARGERLAGRLVAEQFASGLPLFHSEWRRGLGRGGAYDLTNEGARRTISEHPLPRPLSRSCVAGERRIIQWTRRRAAFAKRIHPFWRLRLRAIFELVAG